LKTISQLDLGFTDAQSYSHRHNKQKFNEIFVKNSFLDDLLKPSTYFLIGEKGTGKTAYATFLSNNEYKNTKSVLNFLSATDYTKFYTLKKQKNLTLTDYSGIWKVIILLLLSKNIAKDERFLSKLNGNLSNLLHAIDEYYMNAFSPEIITAFKVIDESELFAKLVCKYVETGKKSCTTYEFSETRFQMNLFYIEKQFCEAISKIKLTKSINLFIDGIDIRPDSIPYNDYIECIRGLANAAWTLNTSIFQNLRDSKGQIKVVLLLRPDIYNTLQLQNATNKLLDNSVFMDWRTTYNDYENSYLYKVALKILSYQQEEPNEKIIWDNYFKWQIPTALTSRNYDSAFVEFLRISLSRPRDILAILHFIQKKMINDRQGACTEFLIEAYRSDEFQNNYSEYFMSSLKDQLNFYYSAVDFGHFIKFFDYFNDSDFSYKTYLANYKKYIDYILNSLNNTDDIPEFIDESGKLLQLLYDSNTITAIENQHSSSPFFHFSYREKSSANISPKVPIGDNITYRFHYGLYKKAKFGRF
jgi:hypothetical protein